MLIPIIHRFLQNVKANYKEAIRWVKVAWNYSYVASTTAINNAAASQLPAIKLITR